MESYDTFISFGDAVKTLARNGNTATIGARGIIFGSKDSKDLSGDWFTAKTYFGALRGEGVDMMLNHGIPLSSKPEFKIYADTLLPPVFKTEIDDDGLLYQAVFDLKDKYQKKIYKMVEDGLLSSSSGAISHSVKRTGNVKNGEVERWIIGEMSLTPHPCEFRLGHVSPLKSLMGDDVFELDSMRAAIKTMGDESFSLNVPLDLKPDKSLVEMEGDADLFEDDYSFGEEAKSVGRSFGTHMTQPRDDHGRWTDGAGKLSASHVAHVMTSEGIHESKHGEVLSKIKSGEHMTRADVLKHIDAIHAAGGSSATSSTQSQATSDALHEAHTRMLSKAAADLNKYRKKLNEVLDDQKFSGGESAMAIQESQKMKELSNEFNAVVADVHRSRGTDLHIGSRIDAIGKKAKLYFNRAQSARKSEDDDIEYSNEDETKHLTALEFGQIEGSRFVDHLSRALAANGEFHERIEDLVSDRASNRKSGRVLSADKHAQISEYRDGLQTIVESLSALLEEHNPNADANAEAGTKSVKPEEIQATLAKYAATMARLSGVQV